MSDPRALEHDWFPATLPPNVVIGDRSWLHSAYAFLHYRSERPCGLRVGCDTGVYIDTFFDLGPRGEVEVGSYCTLAGPIISTNSRVIIGDYVLISRETVIADSPLAEPAPDGREARGDECVPPQVAVSLGDNVWVGARAVLLAGARLGEGVIVGAGAVVDFEAPPYAIVAGNPARVVGWARPERS